jgi:hypothetical protein
LHRLEGALEGPAFSGFTSRFDTAQVRGSLLVPARILVFTPEDIMGAADSSLRRVTGAFENIRLFCAIFSFRFYFSNLALFKCLLVLKEDASIFFPQTLPVQQEIGIGGI